LLAWQRDREGGERIRFLAANIEVLAARCQDLHPRTRLQQLLRQFGAGMREMLAVVEHEQQVAVLYEFHHRFEHRPAGFFFHAQHGRHDLRDQACVSDGRHLHEPHAVGIVVQHLGRHLQ
jgi:hypothetical protein